MPREYTKLFKHHIYSINLSMVPACIKAYETLGVKHEPLTLIAPHFETPLPPTQASVRKIFAKNRLAKIFQMISKTVITFFNILIFSY